MITTKATQSQSHSASLTYMIAKKKKIEGILICLRRDLEKNVGFIHQVIADLDFPGWSGGKYGMQVKSLDWELRSHMPWSN